MMEKEILVLNTMGFFFETALGIWIFSQAFPRRKEMVWEWRLILNEALLHGFLLFTLLWNFEKCLSKFGKVAVCFGLVGGEVLFRSTITNNEKIERNCRKALEIVVESIEYLIIAGILSWNYWLGYISVSMVYTGNLFLPFFYYKHYKCKFLQAYIFEVIYIGLVQSLRCAYMFYTGGNEARSLLEVNRLGAMHTLSGVLFGFGVYGVIWVMSRLFPLGKILKKALEQYRWQMFLIALTESMFLNFATDLGWEKIQYQDVRVVVVSAAIILFSVLLLFILLLKKSFETEQKILSVRNEAIEHQYVELKNAYEENRCLIHDERHKMQYLRECMENKEYEKARIFLGVYEEELERQRRKHWSPISTLDFILNMKIRRIEGLGIQFKIKTNADSIKIDESDFVVLLGNLLDNAIEATAKCPLENRAISLWLQEVNEMLLITMENTAAAEPDQKNGRFLTSKKNKKEHGWGVQSMKHIVEKYGGDIEFKSQQGLFRVEITFWEDKEKR